MFFNPSKMSSTARLPLWEQIGNFLGGKTPDEVRAAYEELQLKEASLQAQIISLETAQEALKERGLALDRRQEELHERETHLVELSGKQNERKQQLMTVQDALKGEMITKDEDLNRFYEETIQALHKERSDLDVQIGEQKRLLEETMAKLSRCNATCQTLVDEASRYQHMIHKYKQEASNALAEKKVATEYATKKLEAMASRVSINLQGVKTLQVSVSLLLSRENSIFPSMLNDDVLSSLKKLNKMELFFDADPELFEYVLDYLRYGEINYPYKSEDSVALTRLANTLKMFQITDARINLASDKVFPEMINGLALDRSLATQYSRVAPLMFHHNVTETPELFTEETVVVLPKFNGMVKMVGNTNEMVQSFYVRASDLGLVDPQMEVKSIDRMQVTDEVATDAAKAQAKAEKRDVGSVPEIKRMTTFLTGELPLSEEGLTLTPEFLESYRMPSRFQLSHIELMLDIEDTSVTWTLHKDVDGRSFGVHSDEYHSLLRELSA